MKRKSNTLKKQKTSMTNKKEEVKGKKRGSVTLYSE